MATIKRVAGLRLPFLRLSAITAASQGPIKYRQVTFLLIVQSTRAG
jgi:hypothetical protein